VVRHFPDVITSFRSWKGNQYVPSTVHKSIRWSTRHPWLESEVLSLEECLELLEKMREKRSKEKCADKPLKHAADKPLKHATELGIGKPNEQKRRQSSGLFQIWSATSTRTSNKQKTDSQQSQHHARHGTHYTAPIGMRWSNNSCAYDSIFTPIYAQWCASRVLWTEVIRRTGSPSAVLLLEGFIRYEAGQESLEDA